MNCKKCFGTDFIESSLKYTCKKCNYEFLKINEKKCKYCGSNMVVTMKEYNKFYNKFYFGKFEDGHICFVCQREQFTRPETR